MILKLCSRCKKNLIPLGQRYCEECSRNYKPEKRNRKDYFKKYNEDRTDMEKDLQLFYSSPSWQELRKYILAKYKYIDIYEYYENHHIVEATLVHHIIETKINPDMKMDKYNLVPCSYKTHQYFHYVLKEGTEEDKQELRNKLREYCDRFRKEFGIDLDR